MFDTYWQHSTAVPLAGFIKPLENPEQALDEYYGAFGPTAEAVRDYFDYWEGFTTEHYLDNPSAKSLKAHLA